MADLRNVIQKRAAEITKTSAPAWDARTVGRVLRDAGFTPAKVEGSRIRGAPLVTEGYTAKMTKHFFPDPVKGYITNQSYRMVIEVTWESNWSESHLRDLATDAKSKKAEMAQALEAAGFNVEQTEGKLLVNSSSYTPKSAAAQAEWTTLKGLKEGDQIGYHVHPKYGTETTRCGNSCGKGHTPTSWHPVSGVERDGALLFATVEGQQRRIGGGPALRYWIKRG